MFNAYAVTSGRELVFCNQATFGFLGLSPGHVRRHDIPGEDISTEYRPIDADAVRAALWLTLYGFSNRYAGETAIDGAYQRQLIMSELTGCDVIYAIKPQASAWRARPPATTSRSRTSTPRCGSTPPSPPRSRPADGPARQHTGGDPDRAHHHAPPAGLLQLLRRKAAQLHRGLPAGPADLPARPSRSRLATAAH